MSSEIVTFIDTNRLSVKEPRQGWRGRFFHSPNMTFAYYTVAAGAWIHEHSHPHDEVWNVIDGQLEITIAPVRPGSLVPDVPRLFLQMLLIPSRPLAMYELLSSITRGVTR